MKKKEPKPYSFSSYSPKLQTSGEKKTLNHPEKWALLPITKRTPNIKNQDPFSTLGSLKLANLMFNWSAVENNLKLKFVI